MNERLGVALQIACLLRITSSAGWKVTAFHHQLNTQKHTWSEAHTLLQISAETPSPQVPDAHRQTPFIPRPHPRPFSSSPPPGTSPPPPNPDLPLLRRVFSSALRTPREPVTPPAKGLAKRPTSPLPSTPRPGGAAVPSAAEEAKGRPGPLLFPRNLSGPVGDSE